MMASTENADKLINRETARIENTLRKILLRAFLALIVLTTVLSFTEQSAYAARPDAPQYAKHGPFAVGTREVTIADPKRPLNVTIWYPALNPQNAPEQTNYTYLGFTLAGHALRDADPDLSQGPYPLVVFSHGLGGLRLQSLFFTEHLASYGFVVMAADHPDSTATLSQILTGSGGSTLAQIIENFALRPSDILREIAYADVLTAKGGTLAGTIDTQRIALSGHSFGGYTAMAAGGAALDLDELRQWCSSSPDPKLQPEAVCFLTSADSQLAALRGLTDVPKGVWPPTTDPRIKAVVAMAPWNAPIFGKDGLAAFTVPAMLLVGTKDQATIPERDAYTFYDQIGSRSKTLVTFDDANHYVFVDPCPAALENTPLFPACSDSVWDMNRVHDLINHLTTAYLLATVKGDSDAAKALQPSAVNFVGVNYKTN